MNTRVSGKEKLAYSAAIVADIPFTTITSSFLLIYYTNVVGLSPAACATLFLIARIVDGLNDPLVGFLLDRRKNTKYGKFRPTLMVGGILCSLNFLLLWFGPYFSSWGKLTLAYISYLLLGVLFPVMDISLNSLLPLMTDNPQERSTLSSIRGGVQQIANLMITFIAPLIIADTSKVEGYFKVAVLVVVIGIAGSTIGALGVKEHVTPQERSGYQIKDFAKVFRVKAVWVFFVTGLFSGLGVCLMATANTYYFTYLIGGMTLYSKVSVVNSLAVIPALMAAKWITDKVGQKRTLMMGMLLIGVAPLLRFCNLSSVVLVYISVFFMALGQGLRSPLQYGMMATLVDQVELELGIRTEAGISSLMSFLAKISMGIAGAIPGYMLQIAGFNGSETVQSQAVTSAILLCTLTLPALFQFGALFLMGISYPVNKEKEIELESQMKLKKEKAK